MLHDQVEMPQGPAALITHNSLWDRFSIFTVGQYCSADYM